MAVLNTDGYIAKKHFLNTVKQSKKAIFDTHLAMKKIDL